MPHNESESPLAQVSLANGRRVLIVAIFIATNLGFRLLGIEVPARVFAVFAGWLLLAGLVHLAARSIRTRERGQQLHVLALLGDITLITAHHVAYSNGWWIGAVFFALIAVGAQTLVSRESSRLVTSYAVLCFNALVLLQVTGYVGASTFLPNTSLVGRFDLAIIVAATGTIGLLALVEAQRSFVQFIRRSDQRHRLLLETASDMIFTTDLQGRFLSVNRAVEQLTGFTPSELLGQPFLPYLVPEDRERVAAHFKAAVDGTPQRYDLAYLHRDGSTRWLSCTASPIEEYGSITGVLAVGRDTTEERQREHQLRQTERLASLGTLVGGVAHELNNPLTGIKCFAEMLLEESSATGDERESLAIIRREADRAAKIVSDLRLVARQTYEGKASDRALVDLNDVVDHVVRLRKYSLETRDIVIRTDIADGLATVEGNRAELEQVLVNLVVNAEQAMDGQTGQKMLIIRTRPSSFGVCLQVVDSGPGIPPEHLGRIFDPFFTTKSPGEGTGLGLSLVHSIVTEHLGTVRADSTVGRGAVFTIELPSARGVRAVVRPRPVAEHAVRPLRILVVDDEESIRRSLVRYLERRGHTVQVAASGAEALQRIQDPAHAPFDIILTDLRMPELGGDQLYRLLRERGDGLERRLVFVTGDSATSTAHTFLGSTGQPVLMKPFALEEVADVVERHAAAA